MRISNNQKREILNSFEKHLNTNYQLYLIGSRTKNHLKGGDIDLLLIVNESDKDSVVKIKFLIVNEIMKQKSIDDTRVDITIGTKEDLTKDPFISTLNEQKIRLSSKVKGD